MTSSFVLPAQVGGGAAGWALGDWQSIRKTATADATGTATIDCGQVDPTTQWLVDRVVVQCAPSGTTPPTLRLYDTTVAASNLLDGTPAGALNSNDYPQGLLVRPSTSLVAQWTGAPAGATCTVTLQVRVFRRGS